VLKQSAAPDQGQGHAAFRSGVKSAIADGNTLQRDAESPGGEIMGEFATIKSSHSRWQPRRILGKLQATERTEQQWVNPM
jgi:hypothetical protein